MKNIVPEIITSEIEVFPVDKNTSHTEIIKHLTAGKNVLIEDYYSTGLKIMAALKGTFKDTNIQGYNKSRKARELFRKLSHKVFLEVQDHQLIVNKAPQIPWLKNFYPDKDYFAISFPHIQALNSSWQAYYKGIEIPGLNHKIHPYYGVYYPTRFDHIELFTHWLNEQEMNGKTAYDIGCGCGLLSFLMEKAGAAKIWATDVNPNAITGLKESITKQSYHKIEAYFGDLFAKTHYKADFVVFNPPWLPEPQNNIIDTAVYYDDDLFLRFFEEAHKHLNENAKVLILFSDLMNQTHPEKYHPIHNELIKNERFVKKRFISQKVSKGSKKTKRNTSKRDSENVELWELVAV